MTSFITTLGANWIALLTTGMPYLDPTHGGTCAVATDAKSVFDLGQINTPAVVVVPVAIMAPNGAPHALGQAVQQTTITARTYLVAKNFNRATADGKIGVLDEPGTDEMIADMIATCHGRFIVQNPTGDMQAARLFPGVLTWMGDTNSKIIYSFDWRHMWPLVEVG